MRARIFTLHHFIPDDYFANEVYAPLVAGQKLGPHPVLISDEHGDNISAEPAFTDMRGQYYVWKNLLAAYDYVGFQHYRRYIFFDQMPAVSQEPMFMPARRMYLRDPVRGEISVDDSVFNAYRSTLQTLDAANIASLIETIGSYDLIVIRPQRFPLGQQYAQYHSADHWNMLVRVLARHSRRLARPDYLDPDLVAFYGLNVYVMRAELFDDYMTFWHEAIREFAALVKPPADPYQARIYGFVSERIFCFYLYQLRLARPKLHMLELAFLKSETQRI